MEGSDDDDFQSPYWRNNEEARKRKGEKESAGSIEKKTKLTKKVAVDKILLPGYLPSNSSEVMESPILASSSNVAHTQIHSNSALPKQEDRIMEMECVNLPRYDNRSYGSLAIKLVNMGLISYIEAPLENIIDTGEIESFPDILKGNEELQQYFTTSEGTCGPLEVSLEDLESLGSLRDVLMEQEKGPYGSFVWINLHKKPSKLIVAVAGIEMSPAQHRLHHQLNGFIFIEGDEYKCIVRNEKGWINAISMDSVTQLHCMHQLSSNAVSLLYGYTQSKLCIQPPQARFEILYMDNAEKMEFARCLDGRGFERYNRKDDYQRSVKPDDCNYDHWTRFGARILNVDTSRRGFEMSRKQRNRLRQMISEGENVCKDSVQANCHPTTIHLEGYNFLSKVASNNTGSTRKYKLCQICLGRYYATDASGRWLCFHHVPDNGSAGIFCMYYFRPFPLQAEIIKAHYDIVKYLDAPLHNMKVEPKVAERYYTFSSEEAMHVFSTASCLLLAHNVLYNIASIQHPTYIRSPIMTSAPKYYKTDVDAMCRFLGISISTVQLTETGITDNQLVRFGVLFPRDGKMHPTFPYIYLKEYEGDGSTLFYIGKSSLGLSQFGCRRVCNSKRDLGSHLRNTVIIQTPRKDLLDTIESATQFAYSLAFILNINKEGKKVAVANKIIEGHRAVLNRTTYLDYVKLIFRHEFLHELIITKRE